MTIVIIVLAASFTNESSPYMYVLIVNSTVGIIINYLFPIIIYCKYSNDSISSAKNIILLSSLYLLYVCSVSSSYMNFVNYFDWNKD